MNFKPKPVEVKDYALAYLNDPVVVKKVLHWGRDVLEGKIKPTQKQVQVWKVLFGKIFPERKVSISVNKEVTEFPIGGYEDEVRQRVAEAG